MQHLVPLMPYITFTLSCHWLFKVVAKYNFLGEKKDFGGFMWQLLFLLIYCHNVSKNIRQKTIKISEILAVLHNRGNTSAPATRTLVQGDQNIRDGRHNLKWEADCGFQFSLSSDTREEIFFQHGHQGLLVFTPCPKLSIPSIQASVTFNNQNGSVLIFTTVLSSLKCQTYWIS